MEQEKFGFKIGDEVKFSQEWLDNCRPWQEKQKLKRGKIVGFSYSNPNCVYVKWDTLKKKQRYHHSFLVKVKNE